MVAIADKLLEYQCIPTKQLKFLLHKCLNEMKITNQFGKS